MERSEKKFSFVVQKGSGDSVAGLVVFAPGMVLLDRVKQGDQSFILSLDSINISNLIQSNAEIVTCSHTFNLLSLAPRLFGVRGKKEPGIYCLRMRLII